MPAEVTRTLTNSEGIDQILRWEAEPEVKLPFDSFAGEPRNTDLLIQAQDRFGALVIAVEAKADEPFSETVADALAAAVERKLKNDRSNGVTRIEQLATAILGPRRLGEPALKGLRYQLLTACAGVLCEAERRGVDRAVLLIHEFVTDQTADDKILANGEDLNRFLDRLSHGAIASAEPGRLYGPFTVPRAPMLSAPVKLFIGKARRNTRSKR